MRTMKELAQEALDVQSACNLSGCIHAFSRTITELRSLLEAEGGFSTDKLNQHHICVLFASKIASLTGGYLEDNDHQFMNAYHWASDLAGT